MPHYALRLQSCWRALASARRLSVSTREDGHASGLDTPDAGKPPHLRWRPLYCVASLLFLAGVLLARPALASAHPSAAASRQDAQARVLPGGTLPDPCLVTEMYHNYPLDGPNTATFIFAIYNDCGYPVKNIAVMYSAQQTGCEETNPFMSPPGDGVGTGDSQGSFSAPNLDAGQLEETTLSLNSYCILCRNGVIAGWPFFSIGVTITQVRGFYGAQLAVLEPNPNPLNPNPLSPPSALLFNDAFDPGPLNCLAPPPGAV